MGQIVTNKTGRRKILHKGEKPEIQIFAKSEDDGFRYETKLNISNIHKFKEDYRISLQAYEKNGIALKPLDMGTVGNPSDLAQVYVREINIDRVLFRIKIYDENKILKGAGDMISLAVDEEGGQKDKSSSNTLLPIQETDKIKVPFQIEMEAGVKPVLLLKSKLNLKEKFKNNIIIKTLIYTASIKEILFNYINDPNYNNDIFKDKFINAIISNSGNELFYPSKDILFDDEGKYTEEGLTWIDDAVAACINKTINFQGLNTSLMKQFSKDISKLEDVEVDDEN
jgi:hypothetical protein